MTDKEIVYICVPSGYSVIIWREGMPDLIAEAETIKMAMSIIRTIEYQRGLRFSH